jgi:TonB family protein
MATLEGNRPPQLPGATEASPEPNQRRIMLAALALLLIALILVLIKDRQFWFPDNATTEATTSDRPDANNPQDSALIYDAKTPPAAVSSRVKSKAHNAAPAVPVTSLEEATAPVVNRAALPALDVEVVAGDQRQSVRSANPSVKVDMQAGSPPLSPAAAVAQTPDNGVSPAGERVRLSANTQQLVTHSVEPAYPTLAKQMKVQGSVVLQALIGKEGTIQDLQVVSGPQILSSAAREAVMQWRFRPYLQSGQAIETQAKITVNFTISTY